MADPDVVFCLTGDARKNSRALRQLRSLAASGYSIDILTFGPPASPGPFEPNIRLRVIDLPLGSGPRFFYEVHRRFVRAALKIPARLYHASDLYSLPAMRIAANRYGSRLVYDARELYPFVASTTGRPWVTLVWKSVEARNIRGADHVFTVSDSIAGYISDMYRIPVPSVLYNVPPFQQIATTTYLRDTLDIPSDHVIVLHQGQMRKDRGCTRLIDAMRFIKGAVLVFLGEGPMKDLLAKQVKTAGIEHCVLFLDPVPPDQLLAVTASADIGVTFLEDTCLNHRYALPNKLFEYLMAGLPVLSSDLPEIRRVVAKYQVGSLVDPEDPTSLVQSLQNMIDFPEARKQWASQTSRVFETFSWEKASQALLRVYDDLLSTERA